MQIANPKSQIQNFKWWQTSIIYQIYPRSFQDSNGDGIGDLPGIIQRLDYLQQLGVGVIWISPIYPSPMADFGYDVADYCDIHPIFGTLDDFDRLLNAAHARGLKVVLDLVPNHTSDIHPWFVASRSSRTHPKRDWYIWRDPAPEGGVPNNWLSVFGGSAWEWDALTGQYYLHSFDVRQPDLNYRHPDVLPAMLNVVRFWLDRGVDGFRVDVITRLLKDAEFHDAPINPNWNGIDPYDSLLDSRIKNLPQVHGIIKEMRRLLDQYPDRMMVGETYLPLTEVVKYYGDSLDECHMPFNFRLIFLEWQAQVIRDYIRTFEASLPQDAWGNWVLGNHDRPRIASRIGTAQARVANMLLLTLRGTPTTYCGEEIGMVNGEIPSNFIQDPPALKQPAIAHIIGRDPERTPMQWDASPNAGFTLASANPWLPVASNFVECNVAQQQIDSGSMLNLYRALARIRRAEAALSIGDYLDVETGVADVVAYIRRAAQSDQFLIVLNFGAQTHTLDLSGIAPHATIAVATDMQRAGALDLKQLTLFANEGLLLSWPA